MNILNHGRNRNCTYKRVWFLFFIVSGKAIAPADYTSVSFVFVYNYNINQAWFTNAFLYKEEFGQTYTYDEDGNIASVVDISNKKSSFAFENNMLKKLVNPTGSEYTYDYDEKKNLTKAKTSDGQQYDFTYDSHGNPLTAVFSSEDGESKQIKTTASYTDDGNYIETLSDARGNEITYDYDSQKGLLNSQTDANGVTTTYTYDAQNDRLLSTTSGGTSVQYTYANDRLDTIVHNNGQVHYGFVYDQFGRTINVTVGNGTQNRTLSTNLYNNRGLLSLFTYGNGDTVSYTYDSMDRQTEKWFGDPAKKVRYYYTLDNSLGVISDEILNTHTRYTYDLAGRVVKEEIRENANSDTGALIRKTAYTYEDGTNRLLSRNDTLFGSSKTTTYVYGNQSQNQMVDAVYSVSYDGADSLHYEYDSLGRRTERMIALTVHKTERCQRICITTADCFPCLPMETAIPCLIRMIRWIVRRKNGLGIRRKKYGITIRLITL